MQVQGLNELHSDTWPQKQQQQNTKYIGQKKKKNLEGDLNSFGRNKGKGDFPDALVVRAWSPSGDSDETGTLPWNLAEDTAIPFQLSSEKQDEVWQAGEEAVGHTGLLEEPGESPQGPVCSAGRGQGRGHFCSTGAGEGPGLLEKALQNVSYLRAQNTVPKGKRFKI